MIGVKNVDVTERISVRMQVILLFVNVAIVNCIEYDKRGSFIKYSEPVYIIGHIF